MTDKKIIKTAECCLQAETREDCYSLGFPCNSLNGCVLFNRTDGNPELDVTYEIIKELLGVINRQQEQLEAIMSRRLGRQMRMLCYSGEEAVPAGIGPAGGIEETEKTDNLEDMARKASEILGMDIEIE